VPPPQSSWIGPGTNLIHNQYLATLADGNPLFKGAGTPWHPDHGNAPLFSDKLHFCFKMTTFVGLVWATIPPPPAAQAFQPINPDLKRWQNTAQSGQYSGR
jgi:hypothetical protein